MKGRKRTAFCGFCAIFLLFSLAACGGKTPAAPPEDPEELPAEAEEMFLTIGSRKISVKLEKNDATAALIDILEEGEITYIARDYGGFEKVGELGHALPRSDVRQTTGAGDVILYSGNQIVLFYGSNTWSYTKLGTMQGLSAAEVREILTAGDPVTVTIGLR